MCYTVGMLTTFKFNCRNCGKSFIWVKLKKNHNIKTYTCSTRCRQIIVLRERSEEEKQRINKLGSLAKLGEKNPNWKGDGKIHYATLHTWLYRHIQKSIVCERCKKVPPHDLANISSKYNPKTYNRDFKNWEWLCRRCHMIKDGRLEHLQRIYHLKCKTCGVIFNSLIPNQIYCGSSRKKTGSGMVRW